MKLSAAKIIFGALYVLACCSAIAKDDKSKEVEVTNSTEEAVPVTVESGIVAVENSSQPLNVNISNDPIDVRVISDSSGSGGLTDSNVIRRPYQKRGSGEASVRACTWGTAAPAGLVIEMISFSGQDYISGQNPRLYVSLTTNGVNAEYVFPGEDLSNLQAGRAAGQTVNVRFYPDAGTTIYFNFFAESVDTCQFAFSGYTLEGSRSLAP